MKRASHEQNGVFHFKTSTYEELLKFFATVESDDSILERIETNAQTFMSFRLMNRFDRSSLREVKRGLFGRIETAEVWLNNSLKTGQLKLFWNKIHQEKPEEEKVLLNTATPHENTLIESGL